MREVNLDIEYADFPTDMRGQHENSRNGGSDKLKGIPKSESHRAAMREAYQKRRDSGWKQTHNAETRAKIGAASKGNTYATKFLYHTPDGVMRLKDAVEYYGKYPSTIIDRVKSSNPKFNNWYRIPFNEA